MLGVVYPAVLAVKASPSAWQLTVKLPDRNKPLYPHEPSLSVPAWFPSVVATRAPSTGRPPQTTRPQISPVLAGAPTVMICEAVAMPPFMFETWTVTRYWPALDPLLVAAGLFPPLAAQVCLVETPRVSQCVAIRTAGRHATLNRLTRRNLFVACLSACLSNRHALG